MTSSYKNKNIMITGSTGFIGANLVYRLLSLGANIHLFLRERPSTWRIDDILDKVTLHYGNLSNYKEVENAIHASKIDTVFHLATARGIEENDILLYYKINILSAVNLIEVLRKDKSIKLIVSGSSTEYGGYNLPIKEDFCLNPTTVLGATKAAASLLFEQASHAENLFISQLRLFHVYGPWESKHRFLPTALKLAQEDRVIPLTKNISKRDWIHVYDVVEALLLSALPDTKKGVYNIGNGIEYSNHDIIDTISQNLNSKIEVSIGTFPNRATDSLHRYANNALAKKELNWQPKYDIHTGIAQMIHWTKEFPEYWKLIETTKPPTSI